MARRRPVPPPKPKAPVLTVGQKQRRIEWLQKCIQRLEAFDPKKVQKRLGVPEVLALEEAIDKALSSAFGRGTPAYMRYNLAATLDHGLITQAALASTVVSPVGGPRTHDAQAQEARQYFSEGKERSVALLREAIGTLEREIADAQPVAEAAQESKDVADADHSPPGEQVAEATQKPAEVLQPRWRAGIDLKAAWRRVGRWWRGRN
jgi:uncharacterized small protein (DUF1192 family)